MARGLCSSRTASAAHSAADQKNVSTPDQGDIGRGQHNEIQDGGVLNGEPHQDVVPNEVIPDEHSSKPAGESGGLDAAIGFKKEAGAGEKPLATPTTAKPVSTVIKAMTHMQNMPSCAKSFARCCMAYVLQFCPV